MGCGCFSCGECVKFLSGSPGKSGSGSVDDFPDILVTLIPVKLARQSIRNQISFHPKECSREIMFQEWIKS